MCYCFDQQLYQHIFAEYNPLIRPVQNISETITISFNLALSQIINVVSTRDAMFYDVIYDVVLY